MTFSEACDDMVPEAELVQLLPSVTVILIGPALRLAATGLLGCPPLHVYVYGGAPPDVTDAVACPVLEPAQAMGVVTSDTTIGVVGPVMVTLPVKECDGSASL